LGEKHGTKVRPVFSGISGKRIPVLERGELSRRPSSWRATGFECCGFPVIFTVELPERGVVSMCTCLGAW